MAMSPVELRFEERRFDFVEARGNQRLYRDAVQARLMVFDLATMELSEFAVPKEGVPIGTAQVGDPEQVALKFQIATPVMKQWLCERYKML